MATLEEIAAMKIKTTCDPFLGRKTQKDLADIATLLEKFTIKGILEFFREKYPTVAPYKENVIIELGRNFDVAEKNSIMPKMFNHLTWETTKHKIKEKLKEFFDELLQERETELKKRNKDQR